jgi:hypothetical protein
MLYAIATAISRNIDTTNSEFRCYRRIGERRNEEKNVLEKTKILEPSPVRSLDPQLISPRQVLHRKYGRGVADAFYSSRNIITRYRQEKGSVSVLLTDQSITEAKRANEAIAYALPIDFRLCSDQSA